MTVATSRLEELRAIVGDEFFVTGEGLKAYRLGDREPWAAILPADEAEISRSLTLAWDGSLGVVPWGGGSHQSIGSPPSRYDLAIDLARLNRLCFHEPADMTATAQAGIRMAELQRLLGKHGQFLPLDVSGPDRATLGGVLATRLAGPLRCRYGTTRDLILGVRVAGADGTVTNAGARVVKNATGYDVTKLYLGSHGCLGIILEATFRVYPRPEVERGWWLSAHTLETAQALADRILGSPLAPNRVELLDEGAARRCGAPGPGLVVSIAGLPETVDGQLASLERMSREAGVSPDELSGVESICTALSNFPWPDPGEGDRRPRTIWRGGVLPGDCARAIRAIREKVTGSVEVEVAATTSHGALRGRFVADASAALGGALKAARDAIAGLGGYLTVLDLPEDSRSGIEVWGDAPEGLGLMKRLKAAFDARDILNPGRFVGGM